MDRSKTLPDTSANTPAMKQWLKIKKSHPNHIILFRMGDFYEMFYEDAIEASKILGIALTKRGTKEKIPLAGIPHKSLEQYLKKFVDAKKKVIIVEQLEDPKKAKNVVKRGVVKEITPGAIAFSEMIPEHENNYIASLYISDTFDFAITDITTGEIYYLITESKEELENQFFLYEPKEVLIADFQKESIEKFFKEFIEKTTLTTLNREFYSLDSLKSLILPLFPEIKEKLLIPIGVLLKYIHLTQHNDLSYFKKPKEIDVREEMYLDESTIRNLDLLVNSFYGNTKATLFEVLNCTKTPMGVRLLKKFIIKPLMNLEKIKERLKIVEYFVNDVVSLETIQEVLEKVYDIERLITKIYNNTAHHSDLIKLKNSLINYRTIYELVSSLINLPHFEETKEVIEIIEESIEEDVTSEYIIKSGYNKEFDDLVKLKDSANEFIQELEVNEKKKTGIQNLRVKYNKVIGFFIEVPKAQAKHMPSNYIRKQTLVNAERFITPELKEIEQKFLSAEERIKELQEELFNEIINKIKPHGKTILNIADKIAYIDVLSGFARISLEYDYTKPIFEGNDIVIVEGRHPVVERYTDFIPNDTTLMNHQVHIITGPNMSGKSTYLRQVALIQLMAQIGCFVPAKYAKLPIVDAIFTRIGARDNIALGESTFMVELKETSNILKRATQKSLIILDEIGRGTSTYDGISLAWSITEYIIRFIRAKTLFATHYHVLTHLSHFYENVKNYHTVVKETSDGVIFEKKIEVGGLDKSYGIEVAKLAKLPQWIIDRAYQLQSGFEKYDNLKDNVVKALINHSIIENKEIERNIDESIEVNEQLKKTTSAISSSQHKKTILQNDNKISDESVEKKIRERKTLFDWLKKK